MLWGQFIHLSPSLCVSPLPPAPLLPFGLFCGPYMHAYKL
uniref:Uncharacterized protein n=1 Tax=Rhizophora mucronata TaxID=61149 RepID=A0A2P2QWP2_RHIMU